jgi:hypothetical protein
MRDEVSVEKFRSIEQMSSRALMFDTEVIYGVLFWAAVVWGVAVGFWAIVAVLGLFSRGLWLRAGRNRIIFSTFRWFFFVFLSAATVGAYGITRDSTGSVIVGIITLIILIGVIGLIFWLIPRSTSQGKVRVLFCFVFFFFFR